MRIGEHAGNVRRGVPLLLAAVLGAAVVVFPAVAGSETAPAVEAKSRSGGYGEFEWSPMALSVNSGSAVAITNASSATSHGVHFYEDPATPSCSGVPGASTGQPSFATSWSGTCTFSQPGVYRFYCTYHGSAMSGSMTVNAKGETTGTTTPTYTYPPPPTGSTTGGQGGAGGGFQEAPGASGGLLSPLAGSASSAVKLASSQRGRSVRGSVDIAQAGAGGRLEVDLLARAASLASASGAQASAGKLVLRGVRAGKVSFSVPLNARARAALRRRRHLALSARIQLQAPGTSPLKLTRAVLLRP